jgi:WD40 repeat protein
MPFDAYHKWLGIPPSEQPPDHYRLLGISRFEPDPEVIDSAANRQMAYVQSFAAGEHGAASQQILNELAAARLCLLDARKRAAYDAGLRKGLAAARTDTGPIPKTFNMSTSDLSAERRTGLPVPVRIEQGREDLMPVAGSSYAEPPIVLRRRPTMAGRGRERRSALLPQLGLGGAALAVILIAAVIGILRLADRRTISNRDGIASDPSPLMRSASTDKSGADPVPDLGRRADIIDEGRETPGDSSPHPLNVGIEDRPGTRYPKDAVRFGDHYYKVYWGRTSWPEAVEECGRQGGQLACAETVEEQEFLAGLKGEGKVIWVGGFRNRAGQWQWINGRVIEPSTQIGGHQPGFQHVAFTVGSSLNCRPRGGRVRGYAVEEVQGYICEWGDSPDSNGFGQPFELTLCEPVGEVCPFYGHTDYVNCVALSPDGRFAASGSNDKSVRLWDIRTGREVWKNPEFRHMLRAVSFSPDGRKVFSCDLGSVSILDADTGRAQTIFDIKCWDRARFSRDCRFLFAKHPDGAATIYDVAMQRAIHRVDRKYSAHDGAFTPDGRKALYGVLQLTMLDIGSGRETKTPIKQSCYFEALDVSLDGGLLVSGSGRVWVGDRDLPGDHAIRIWDLRDGRQLARLGEHDGWPWTVAFSPDGRRVLSGGSGRVEDWYGHKPGADNSLRLWDVNSRSLISQFKGHQAAVLSVAYSRDGRYAVSGSSDSTVRLWRLPD